MVALYLMKTSPSSTHSLPSLSEQPTRLRITSHGRPYATRLHPEEIHSTKAITHQLNTMYSNNTDSSLEQPFMVAQLETLDHETW
jgi:hypothetical protein